MSCKNWSGWHSWLDPFLVVYETPVFFFLSNHPCICKALSMSLYVYCRLSPKGRSSVLNHSCLLSIITFGELFLDCQSTVGPTTQTVMIAKLLPPPIYLICHHVIAWFPFAPCILYIDFPGLRAANRYLPSVDLGWKVTVLRGISHVLGERQLTLLPHVRPSIINPTPSHSLIPHE